MVEMDWLLISQKSFAKDFAHSQETDAFNKVTKVFTLFIWYSQYELYARQALIGVRVLTEANLRDLVLLPK